MTVTKNQRSVVCASCMRLRTSSLPRLQAVVKPKVTMSPGNGRSLSIVFGTCATVSPGTCLASRLADLTDGFRGLARVRARGADDGAAVEVDARGVVDLEVHHVLGVALHQPL